MTRHPRLAAKRDANERDIIEAFRAFGCSVHQLYSWADLLVGLGNPAIFIVVEVKKPGTYEMTPQEATFIENQKGAYEVVQSINDVAKVIEKYRNDAW